MAELRFAVIGAGMAGVLSAIRLREAGLSNFTVYEKGETLGGTSTWPWTYERFCEEMSRPRLENFERLT